MKNNNENQETTNWQQVLNFGAVQAKTQKGNTTKASSDFTVLP